MTRLGFEERGFVVMPQLHADARGRRVGLAGGKARQFHDQRRQGGGLRRVGERDLELAQTRIH